MNMARKMGHKLTPNESARHDEIRRQVQSEFPPKAKSASPKPSKDSIAVRLREARKSQGLTWYAVAKAAGIPNSGTIRDIESGRDAKLSNVEAVAKVLGLKLELKSAG
jgi:DNA-binding XRE family transcriptional regulator